jgi:hypothetical protein
MDPNGSWTNDVNWDHYPRVKSQKILSSGRVEASNYLGRKQAKKNMITS